MTSVLVQDHPEDVPPAVAADPEALALPDLVAAGAFHRVLPALHVALRGCPELPAEAGRALLTEHHAQVFRHLAALRDLAWLATRLDDIGCRWSVVKGPYLSEVVHKRADLRSYGDLDVVIDHRVLPIVIATLESDGAVLLDRNWTLIREGERAQTTLLLPDGTPLDLHWHLLNRGPIRHAFHLDMDEMLERAGRVALGPATAPVLDPVDALMHLCLHGTLAGGSRLVWLYDVHALVSNLAPERSDLVGRARANGSALAVAILLDRTHRALGTPVAEGLLEELAPRGAWRSAAALASILRPVASSHGRRRTGRTLIRATRATQASSLREFRRTARRNTVARLMRDTSRPGLGGDDAEGTVNLLWEVGGTAADRDAFFDEVARARRV